MPKLLPNSNPSRTPANGVLNPLNISIGRNRTSKTPIIVVSALISSSIFSALTVSDNQEPNPRHESTETLDNKEARDIVLNNQINFDLSTEVTTIHSLSEFYKKITGQEILSPVFARTESSILIKDNLTRSQILFDGDLENGSIVLWDPNGTSYATCFMLDGQIQNNICFRHN